jgi:hypothetical protein
MLSSERRRAVRDLVEAALKYDTASRTGFIREASHGDAVLSDQALRVLEQIESRQLTGSSGFQSESELIDDILSETADTSARPGDSTDTVAPPEFRGTSRFELRRTLGSGGFGTVYESYDREQRQSVALKVMRRTDPAFLYRFKREFRALVDLRHPNLVELYELFQEREFWFFTMELIRGVNFLEYVEHRNQSKVIAGRAACNIERLRTALLQLFEGIVALHAARILHRDIKPGNVLVTPNGRVRLLDFGLVRELELSSRQSVMVVGTPAYMAPEQLAQLPYDSAADWFSLGVMLFQALTGSLPPRATQLAPASPSVFLAGLVDVSEDLKQLCIDLLNPDPSKRPTGAELRQRLGATPAVPIVITETEDLLIGRGPQLQHLMGLLELTRQGRTVVVNLHGQSGVGKSALIRAFRQRLARTDPDVVMLAGRCHETETVPFKALDALVDDFSRHLTTLPPFEAEALAPRDAASLIRVFPVLAQVDAIANVRRKGGDIVDAQELRQRAFASLQDLFGRLAERKTVVIVIDDLQWGDLDSAAFLRSLFGGPSPPSVLLIASYRHEDAETSPFLKAWQSYAAAAETVTTKDMCLEPLTPSESQELALNLLRSHAGDAVVHVESIARESGGSPFLIEQFVRHMPDRSDDQTGVTLKLAIDSRLDQLPARSRRLLETIAVAGQPLSESIAYVAAECEFSDRPTLFTLVADHLLRVRDTNTSREIEVYHDRLREMILSSMSPERRRQLHRNLAAALEADGAADPAVLSLHHRETGDLDRASHYAWEAGNRAAKALAFERAAEWYQLALESGQWTSEQTTTLRKSLAESLVFAGRGTRAAAVYLAAAETTVQSRRWDFQRLAAEQLLRAGHIDEGLAVLEGIAKELGIWLAPKRWQTLVSLGVHRLRSAIPAFPFMMRISDRDIGRHLMVLDVYRSFFIGLTNFDPIRAMDFHARHRLLAARVGDANRLSLSLAMEAASRAASRGHDSKEIQDLFAQARRLCEETRSPEALGLIATMEAMCASLVGRWREALRLSSEADRFLSEHCSGVAWERATSLQMWDAAVFYLGEWRRLVDYAQRFPKQVEDAKLRGDVHAGVASFSGRALEFLMADQPVGAEQFIRETIAVLPGNRFLMPRVWMLNLEVYSALYRGDGERAWTQVSSLWPALRASQFLRIDYLSIVAFDLRARAAVAAAAAHDRPRHLLAEALRCAERLSRKRSRWASAFATLTRAGVVSVQGDQTAAVDLLERAEGEFLAADMLHCVAACEHRRGMSIKGERGRALIARAETWATSQGIVNPGRIFDMLCPGRWEI